MKINIKLSPGAKMPHREHDYDSGVDLYSMEGVIVPAYSRILINTGVAMEIPVGYEGQVRPCSGNAIKHGLTVLNTPGTIDSNYRGMIGVILFNTNDHPVTINRHQKVAQLVITPVVYADFEELNELTSTSRGADGFGSTDK